MSTYCYRFRVVSDPAAIHFDGLSPSRRMYDLGLESAENAFRLADDEIVVVDGSSSARVC